MDEDKESKIESYVFIGLTSILSLYILIGAYINSKKVVFVMTAVELRARKFDNIAIRSPFRILPSDSDDR